MKQTAVDWLVDQVEHYHGLLPVDMIEKAKAIEKEQIIKAVYDSMGTNFDPNFGRAEEYYNETYRDNLSPRK